MTQTALLCVASASFLFLEACDSPAALLGARGGGRPLRNPSFQMPGARRGPTQDGASMSPCAAARPLCLPETLVGPEDGFNGLLSVLLNTVHGLGKKRSKSVALGGETRTGRKWVIMGVLSLGQRLA